ncbi:MAG: biopolymer transporter ExbD [Verrucomicrobiae bacterium]|jgi:biopolymer transport protein ExbD|nr:biopolymer transporter ExbD [Verrucomicrobiae bacterium]
MQSRRYLEEEDERSEINISPLIDMVFILLIFFIVTTVFVEETGIDVEKPVANTARQLEKKSILIALSASGQVIYGGREIGVQGVRAVVTRLCEKQALPVILQADKSAHADLIVAVMDEAKSGGASLISLSTEPPGS